MALAPVRRQGRRQLVAPARSRASRSGASDVRDIGTLMVSRLTGAPTTCTSSTPAWTRSCSTRRPSTAASSWRRTNYLTTADESVADYVRLYIDWNVYTLTPDERGQAQRRPAAGLRPRRRHPMTATCGRGTSTGSSTARVPGAALYVYDEKWDRILVFLKSDGSYVEQWSTRGPLPSMADVRGMYVTQPSAPRASRPAGPGHLGHTRGHLQVQLTPSPRTRRPPARRPGAVAGTRADADAQAHEEARLRHRERATCPRM